MAAHLGQHAMATALAAGATTKEAITAGQAAIAITQARRLATMQDESTTTIQKQSETQSKSSKERKMTTPGKHTI
jgi:hypothetical protein